MSKMNIKSKLKWWVYIVILTPMGVGIWIISQLSLETQLERFNNDEMGVIFAGLLLFVIFFGWPIFYSTFIKTVQIENSKTISIHYPFRFQTKKYHIREIVEIAKIERLYSFGRIMKGMHLTFESGQKCSFDSRFMTKYDEIEKLVFDEAPSGTTIVS